MAALYPINALTVLLLGGRPFGLPILECPEVVEGTDTGDRLTIDLTAGAITNQRTGRTYRTTPFPDFVMRLIEAGGLVPYTVGQLRGR